MRKHLWTTVLVLFLVVAPNAYVGYKLFIEDRNLSQQTEAEEGSHHTLRERRLSALTKLDQWVGSVEAKESIAVIQAGIVQPCGQLVVTSAESQADFENLFVDNRAELDYRVDVCVKLTAHRVDLQPEFTNPAVVNAICGIDAPIVFEPLCERAGL